MRSRGVWIALVAALALVAPVWARGGVRRHHAGPRVVPPAAAVRPDVGRLAIWARGSWCWFGDPRAVHVAGQYDQTFVGWIGWNGAITVGAYDPSFGLLRTYVVGHLFHDDHGSPAIFVEPDKRLTVFYSGHNGSRMYYRSTLRPEDISTWGPVRVVHSRLRGRLGFTYPNPVLLPAEGNRLYLFWRGSNWGQDYATRSIDGAWSPARKLIAAPGQRPYVKVASNGSDTIALAFTNGHPRERITSLYYAAYRAGSLWHADGRPIARLARAPISPQRGDVVYDGQATGVSSWVWDTAFDARGGPVIVYATFRSVRDHVYWYAHFDGRRWVSHFITYAGPSISPATIEQQYSGGMTLDHSDPSVVYLSRQVGGRFQVEQWTTPDGGNRWSHHTVVANTSDNLRPVVPRGAAGGSTPLLWLHGLYNGYTGYRTSIAFLR